jgi:hypothetical protein
VRLLYVQRMQQAIVVLVDDELTLPVSVHARAERQRVAMPASSPMGQETLSKINSPTHDGLTAVLPQSRV